MATDLSLPRPPRILQRPIAGTIAGVLTAALSALVWSQPAPDPAHWPAVIEQARGQTVYWHAWGGDPRVNAYIAWVGKQMHTRHGVRVEQVKLSDTAEAVSRVLSEKAAGKQTGGSVDLIWLNGENFAAMKDNGLLFGPWAEQLPHWQWVDVAGKPSVRSDFGIATDGLEAPWGMARIVFYYDRARLPEPPRTMPALLDWARTHPGRFAYPQPPDFLGSSFLKQALYGLVDDPAVLLQPVQSAYYPAVTAPLWQFLDALHPHLWRSGRAWPQSGPRLRQLMADAEIDLALSFNPAEASTAIANFELPDTVRTYVLDGGTLGNSSFVAIPYNATARAGAMLLANFLLSPEAQARKQDPTVWGSFTVLDIDALPAPERARFEALPRGVATLSPEQLGPALPEPHPSWMLRIERDWLERYGAGQ